MSEGQISYFCCNRKVQQAMKWKTVSEVSGNVSLHDVVAERGYSATKLVTAHCERLSLVGTGCLDWVARGKKSTTGDIGDLRGG